MAQLVFEFWCEEIGPVVEAIKRVLEGRPTQNELATSSLHYELTEKDLDWAAREISAEQFASFVLRPNDGAIPYVMLNGPNIGGDKRPGYLGTIEYTRKDYIYIWRQLLDVNGLQIVCLGHEEGVEFSAEQLVAETFPWDDFFLVVGAVRTSAGDLVLRNGPSHFPSGQTI